MSLPRPLHAVTAAAVVVAVALGPAHLASAAPAQQLPSADQLKSALLTAADLGPGFTEAPATESPSPGENPSPVSGCDTLSALINMHVGQTGPANPRAETELDGPDGNPMVTEALAAEAPDQLATDFNTVADAFRTCHTITFNAGIEDTVTFTVTPVTLGDRQDAPAVRLDGTLAGVQLNAFIGIERFGTVAMAFGYFQREGASSQTASMQYRTAVAKVERTLGTTAGSTTPPTAVATQGMKV
ncbi:hypothetical protein BX285_5427 [Streptomyces sp. 1114.5]|uniref:hypothetical protein n=1 Tax=unclassified Streptomyces TaxID=2593676 RepID=UPI000BD60A29|nr:MULTISPECIES: hypothetical protein [unclassified Streptomyces]RKT11477.1 hypothetical protein BX285_5427 [Streptomyces sp. 1114.5]SOB81127.1 hypothetical protein SAMN06272789_1300 [Streptomyces sp. 1331.2]